MQHMSCQLLSLSTVDSNEKLCLCLDQWQIKLDAMWKWVQMWFILEVQGGKTSTSYFKILLPSIYSNIEVQVSEGSSVLCSPIKWVDLKENNSYRYFRLLLQILLQSVY